MLLKVPEVGTRSKGKRKKGRKNIGERLVMGGGLGVAVCVVSAEMSRAWTKSESGVRLGNRYKCGDEGLAPELRRW